MEGRRRCYETQIVDGKGNYNVKGVKNFMTATNLSGRGRSYAVVAILGPQHSGKSTIMNHLFGTDFREMDTSKTRRKTTNGIWIAKCAGTDDPFIIAMDVEGTDGKERGEDDTTFEKQSALFALANADLVMINMWCHDLGRENAANKPMLKVVFEVMMSMFSPRKVTLLFVLRDKTQAEQFDNLKADVKQQIKEIWDTATKRHSGKKYDFRKYFRVEVVALSNYHDKKQLFKKEVAQMRDRYFGSNLLEFTLDRLPATVFAISTQQIWNDIKQNKDLDIPAHRRKYERRGRLQATASVVGTIGQVVGAFGAVVCAVGSVAVFIGVTGPIGVAAAAVGGTVAAVGAVAIAGAEIVGAVSTKWNSRINKKSF